MSHPLTNMGGKGLFGRLGVFSFRHAKVILYLGLVFCLGSVFLLKDLRFDTASAVLAVDDPQMKAYVRSMDSFGDSGSLIIRIAPLRAPLSSMNAWTDAVVARLSSWEDIRFVEHSPIGFSNVPEAAALIRAALLNAEPSVLESLAARFEGNGLERELRRHRKRLLAASDPEILNELSADPLNLRQLLRPQLEAALGNMSLAESGRYLDSANGRSRIMIIHPAGLSEDINYSRDLTARVKHLLEEIRRSFPETPEAHVSLSGKYAHSAEASRITIGDMRNISLAASLLIFLLVWLVFGRPRAVLIALMPLFCSLTACFLFARLFFNPLTPVAMAFAAVLLGLGVDILLHSTTRIFQLFPGSPSLEEALRLTMEDCGPPITIGITTTAAAFFCLYFARFKALSQFGLLTACSLIITLIVSLLVFPAAVRLFFPGTPVRLAPRFQKIPVGLFSLSARRPVPALGIGLALLLFSLATARNFRFEMDLFKGIPDSMPSISAAAEIAEDFGTSLVINSQILVEASTIDEVLSAQQAVDQKLSSLVVSKKIAGFVSPSLFLPYPDRIEESRLDLAALGSLIKESRPKFFTLLEDLKIRLSPELEDYYDILASAFPPGGIPSLDALAAMESARARMHVKRQDGFALQTFVWPADKDGDLSRAKDVSEEFAAFSSPNSSLIQVTGAFQFYERLNGMMKKDFFKVSLISLAAVLVLALFFLRKLHTVVLAVIPLLSAVPFTFAALVVLGLSFTPAGIGLTAMVVGIGIDDAVHILVRMRDKPLSRLPDVTREIGPILFLTTLSTMLGFVSLTLSRLYSLRSMGFVVALGVFACLMFTILFIPSLLRISGARTSGPPKAALLLVLGLLALPAYASLSAPPQESRLDRILNRLEKKYNSTDAFAYDFVQIKSLRQMTEPMRFTGTLVFRKPHFIRMEMRGEENFNIYADGEHVWLEDIDFGEVERFDFADVSGNGRLNRILPPFFTGGINAMKDRFQVWLDENPDQDILELIPEEESAFSIRKIRFAVDGLSRILWMRVDYRNGDWTDTRFKGWKTMPALSEHYFRYQKKK